MPIRFFSPGKRKPPSRVVRPNRKRDEAQQKAMANAFAVHWGGGMTRFRQSLNSDELANAYLSGRYGDLMKMVKFGKLQDFFNEAVDKLEGAIDAGATRGFSGITDPHLLRFDLNNPSIRHYIGTRSGSMVEGVTDDFQQTVGHLISTRFASGTSTGNLQMGLLDPVKRHGVAGFVLKNSVGLDTRSANALANRAASGKFSQNDLDEYENELHVRRAGLIARTEVSMAINEGQRQVWDDACDQGLIDKTVARKVWVVDGNPCPKICELMDGVSVGIDEMFLLPNGERVSGPPAHPRCLCQNQIDVDGDDDVAGSNRENYAVSEG